MDYTDWGVGVWNIYIEINREKKIINHIENLKIEKNFFFFFKNGAKLLIFKNKIYATTLPKIFVFDTIKKSYCYDCSSEPCGPEPLFKKYRFSTTLFLANLFVKFL